MSEAIDRLTPVSTGLKAHWFRHSALVRRWKEAVKTRREEMYRTLRSYNADRAKWLTRAGERETAGLLGSAAYARRYADKLNMFSSSHVRTGKPIVTCVWQPMRKPSSLQSYTR